MNCPHCLSPSVQRRGTRRGKRRYFCNNCRKSFAVDQATEPSYQRGTREIQSLEKLDKFVVTSAQNNTPVDQRFWASLQRLAAERGARLLVIPVRYKNPTSQLDPQDSDDDVWWPTEVEPYLIENEVKLHPSLWLLGDVRVAATADLPLSGLESLSAGASAIVGHAQIAMRTVATPQQSLPKIMHTTGSCSAKNYSQTKAGKKGHFHHSLGALIVEKEGSRFHMRIVNGATDGTFYDFLARYSPEAVEMATHIPAIVPGDEHSRFADPLVKAATYLNEDSIVNLLKPRLNVRNDVFDGHTCSGWHRGDTMMEYAKWVGGADGVEDELEECKLYIEETTPRHFDCTNVINHSNHDDRLRRWLISTQTPTPKNALIFHELMYRVLERTRMTIHGAEIPNPFQVWMEDKLSVPVRFLGPHDSLMVHGVELGMHGHLGSNGTRGSLRGLSRIGVKSIIGHTHSPGIEKGCYQVGVSAMLKQDYNPGPSSWFHTHGIVLMNGKRQLVNVIDGHFAHPDTLEMLRLAA